MKFRAINLVLCILLFTSLYAQERQRKIRHVSDNESSDSLLKNLNDIYKVSPTQHRRGVYVTFDEFRRNSPSLPFEGRVSVSDEFKAEENFESYFITTESGLPLEFDIKIWGFCDGKQIFLARRDIFLLRQNAFKPDNIYDRVLFLGRYVVMKSFTRSSSGNGYPRTSAGAPASISLSKYSSNFDNGTVHVKCIDLNDGTYFRLDKSKMEEILAGDSELLMKYKADKNRKKLLVTYLEEYCNKHPEEVIPLS